MPEAVIIDGARSPIGMKNGRDQWIWMKLADKVIVIQLIGTG